ncbi:MAG: hypothetical protein EOL88_08765 [Bacteroidia bacterium]|nr:hypothetical protein [Bacteroidia bacterium]
MNLFRKIYKKGLSVLRREIDRYVKKNIITETHKTSAILDKQSIINDHPRDQKIVVSLTTFGKRIDSVYITIESIARQTLKPDVVILWLAENEFNRNNIPITLRKFEEKGLTIDFYAAIGPYKKLIPTLKKYPEEIIITIDDDMIYPNTLIEKLIKNHDKYPDCICCNQARTITLDKNNNPKPYCKWTRIWQCESPSYEYIPIGVGGVLYFPGCFDGSVTDEDLFLKLSPTNDDLWFKILSLKKGVKTMVINELDPSDFIPLDSSNHEALAVENVGEKMNNPQFMALISFYNINLSKLFISKNKVI